MNELAGVFTPPEVVKAKLTPFLQEEQWQQLNAEQKARLITELDSADARLHDQRKRAAEEFRVKMGLEPWD